MHDWIPLATTDTFKGDTARLSRCALCAVVRVADGRVVFYFGVAGQAAGGENTCEAWGLNSEKPKEKNPDDTDPMYCSVSDVAAHQDCGWSGAWMGVE